MNICTEIELVAQNLVQLTRYSVLVILAKGEWEQLYSDMSKKHQVRLWKGEHKTQ